MRAHVDEVYTYVHCLNEVFHGYSNSLSESKLKVYYCIPK